MRLLMPSEAKRFQDAVAGFDAANAEDPRTVLVGGEERPKELLYAERMTARLERFAPDASEALRLAARAQHIRRWAIPRADYPEGKAGYKRWRRALADFHAETAGGILRRAGYDEAVIERVGELLRKKKLKVDADVQTLEDVICLVFLEHEFPAFAAAHEDAKIVDIVRKTWGKMSPRGQAAALELELAPETARLVKLALTED